MNDLYHWFLTFLSHGPFENLVKDMGLLPLKNAHVHTYDSPCSEDTLFCRRRIPKTVYDAQNMNSEQNCKNKQKITYFSHATVNGHFIQKLNSHLSSVTQKILAARIYKQKDIKTELYFFSYFILYFIFYSFSC